MLGGLLVEIRGFGRKGTLSTSTILTGVFIYGSTTAKTSNQLLAWDCVYSFFSNVMYAVLYAYTPEIFPTKDRGTGNALTATANRVFGIMGKSDRMSVHLLIISTDHRHVRQPGNVGTRIHQWGIVHRGGPHRPHIAIRVPGEGVFVKSPRLDNFPSQVACICLNALRRPQRAVSSRISTSPILYAHSLHS